MKKPLHIPSQIVSTIIFLALSINFLFCQVTYQSSNYAVPGDSFLVSISPESALPLYNFGIIG